MNHWAAQNWVQAVGWSLIHFVWQGGAIAALLAVSLRLLRSANHRYVAGCFALLLVAGSPLVTFDLLWQPRDTSKIVMSERPILSSSLGATMEQNLSPTLFPSTKKNSRGGRANFLLRLEIILPWLVAVWAVGVLVFSFRLFASWLHLKKMLRAARSGLDEVWQHRLVEVQRRLGMTRRVRLLQSTLLEVPAMAGWLRPVILIPVGCLAGLSPQQLEFILAHELAHIGRHDYLVNLLQSTVETVLFYHPAVWWISRQVRDEREHCCDDLAVEACGDRIAYARALATLEELRQPPAPLALAASGPSLLRRIQRLVGKSANPSHHTFSPMIGMIVLAIVFALAFSFSGHGQVGNDKTFASTNTLPVSGSRNAQITNAQISRGPKTINQIFYKNHGRQLISEKLESIHGDLGKFDYLPLAEVINKLADIARQGDSNKVGINFFVDQESFKDGTNHANTNTVSVKIAETLTNATLADLLQAVVKGADRPTQFRVLDYAVVFSPRDTNELELQTRKFHVHSDWLKFKSVDSPQNEMHEFLTSIGIDLNTNTPANRGKMFVWIDRKGILLMRSTVEDLDKIDGVIKMSMEFDEPKIQPLTNETLNPSETLFVASDIFDPQLPKTNFVMKTFHLPPNAIAQALTGDVAAQEKNELIQFLASAGVAWHTNNPDDAGKSFIWHGYAKTRHSGLLMVRSTPEDMEKIEAAFKKITWLGIDYKIKVVEINDANFFQTLAPASEQQAMNRLLTENQFKLTIDAMERRSDIILSMPSFVIAEGQHAVLSMGDEDTGKVSLSPAPSNGALNGSNNPPAPMIDIFPQASWVSTRVATSIICNLSDWQASLSTDGSQSIYHLKSVTNEVEIGEGQTLAMGFHHARNAKLTNSLVMVFVTPTLIYPDNGKTHTDSDPAPVSGTNDLQLK